MLKYFDPNLHVKLSVDISKSGLGNILLQLHKDDKSVEYQVHLLVNNLPISEPNLREIRNATENNQVLQKLKKFNLDCFLANKSSMPPELVPYFQVRS